MAVSNPPPFTVGQRVTTNWFGAPGDSGVVRTVLTVRADPHCESAWRVEASAGDPCPTCGRPPSTITRSLDSRWFKAVGG